MISVGWLSSFHTKCGIAEYSAYLVEALDKREDVEVTVYGSKNYGNYKLETPAPREYIPTFAVPLWNGSIDNSFDYEKILAANHDVVHIQYEVVLYNDALFREFISEYMGVLAITYHDNCIDPKFPYQGFNLQYSHRENVGIGGGYLIPMGIENNTPVVKTFGLGRSRHDIIGAVCEKNGWRFEKSFGEEGWQSAGKLYDWLRDSDAIVLYYDDAPMAGTSIAARVAISTRRPVIVNNTTWFKDLMNDPVPNLTIVSNEEQLEAALQSVLKNDYIKRNSWDQIASVHVEDYKKELDAWA